MGRLVTQSAEYVYTNSGASVIEAGTPVVSSKLFGVAIALIPAGGIGTVKTDGVWELPGTSGETASAGDVAYWDASNSKVTSTASTNLPIGYFVLAKVSADTVVRVLLGAGAQAAAAAGSGAGT